MVREYIRIAIRAVIDLILCLSGLLNLAAVFSPRNRGGPKRVAFQTYSTHLAQLYKSIIDELRAQDQDLQVEFVVLAHPHFPLGSWFHLKRHVEQQLGLPKECVKFYWQALWEQYDLVVYTDVFARFPLRRTKNVILFHGPGLQRRMFKESPLRKSTQDFDAILVNGRYDYQLVESIYGQKAMASKLLAPGFPFLDSLEQDPGITKEAYFEKLELDSAKKTVLFAPHWTALDRIHDANENYFEEVLDVLRQLDVNVVLKLHACSYNKAMGGGIDWSSRIDQLSQDPALHIDPSVDDRPALLYSDILINDLSSRIFNFMLLGKPAVVYFPIRVDWDALDTQRIELMHRGSSVAANRQELRSLLQEHISSNTVNHQGLKVAGECFSNYGEATQAVAQWILGEVRDLPRSPSP